MWWRLFFLFTVTPVVELALLIRVGQSLGILPTIAIVVATGAAGALLARSQGMLALRRLLNAVPGGAFPGEEIFDGVLILMGGLLLLTPGFLTDFIGFAALLPGTRGVLKEIVRRQVRRRIGRRVRTV